MKAIYKIQHNLLQEFSILESEEKDMSLHQLCYLSRVKVIKVNKYCYMRPKISM